MITCRCLFCGETESTKNGTVFIASKIKYGKDQRVWGVCAECHLECHKVLVDHAMELIDRNKEE